MKGKETNKIQKIKILRINKMSDNTFVSNGCQYVGLGQYNSAQAGCMGNLCAPPGSGAGSYMVPQYGNLGYNALTVPPMSSPLQRPLPSCSGYRNIMTAYGAGAGSGVCTSFAPAKCN